MAIQIIGVTAYHRWGDANQITKSGEQVQQGNRFLDQLTYRTAGIINDEWNPGIGMPKRVFCSVGVLSQAESMVRHHHHNGVLG